MKSRRSIYQPVKVARCSQLHQLIYLQRTSRCAAIPRLTASKPQASPYRLGRQSVDRPRWCMPAIGTKPYSLNLTANTLLPRSVRYLTQLLIAFTQRSHVVTAPCIMCSSLTWLILPARQINGFCLSGGFWRSFCLLTKMDIATDHGKVAAWHKQHWTTKVKPIGYCLPHSKQWPFTIQVTCLKCVLLGCGTFWSTRSI